MLDFYGTSCVASNSVIYAVREQMLVTNFRRRENLPYTIKIHIRIRLNVDVARARGKVAGCGIVLQV
jgi:hypothetical protein